MSWIQQQKLQQGSPQQPQQQYGNSQPAAGAGNSPANFVQHQWQNQLPQNYPTYQQSPLMQPQNSIPSNQNNWFNPTLQAVPSNQPVQQNNWQNQPLLVPQQSQPLFSASQQTNENFNLKQPNQNSYPPQQQQNSTYSSVPVANFQPPPLLTQPINSVSENFINTEKMSDNNQKTANILNYQNLQGQNTTTVDGWDDWDWNENNNQQQSKNEIISPSRNQTQEQIVDSFKTEPNDNWQWGLEHHNQNSNDKSNIVHSKNNPQHFENNILSGVTEDVSPFIDNIKFEEKTLASNSFEQSISIENTQNPVATSSVFVSQAKPVSQPPKQFASPAEQNLNENLSFDNQHGALLANMPPPKSPPQLENQNISTAPPIKPINNSVSIPPPPSTLQSQGNPFKRSGSAQHHRTSILSAPPKSSLNSQPLTLMPTSQSQQQFFNPPPPEQFQNSPQSFNIITNAGNQETVTPENSEIINDTSDNIEILPFNNDRNQYMQTSHLSEEGSGFNSLNQNYRNNNLQEQNIENDSFPPPGLSRLVLGQPETETYSINTNVEEQIIPDIPPGLDRMIPGTELVSSSIINLERQADGQDTIPSPTSAFTNVQTIEDDDEITSDRNLYLVPGESEHNQQQQQQQAFLQSSIQTSMPIISQQQQQPEERVVTGIEDSVQPQQNSAQRELELDGENLEDEPQHQNQSNNHLNFIQTEVDLLSPRDEPIEGANTLDCAQRPPNNFNNSNQNETESSLTMETNQKNLSLPSTANDESDERDRQNFSKSSRRLDDKKKRTSGNGARKIDSGAGDRKKDRYCSEETDDNSSEHRDNRRRYREGSAKNDRDKENKENRDRRDKRDGGNNSRYRNEREYREKSERNSEDKDRNERDRRRNDRDKRDRYDKTDKDRTLDRDRERGHRYRRYENDSRYETEGSRYYRDDSDRDRYDKEYRRDDKDRKYRKRGDKDDRSGDDRRRSDRRKDNRDDRGDYRANERKERQPRNKNERNRSDYEDEYRKANNNSRNASDREREHNRGARDKDARYSQLYGYQAGYGYDPYAYYQQQQQYYEQLRRTNPQAYAEWYRKYYGEHGGAAQLHPDIMAATGGSTATGTDGRESVHSGRSSANNDKDRYSIQQQYIPHSVSDYHQHFLQQSNVSSTPNTSMIVEQNHHHSLSSSYHYQQQQQQLLQQQQIQKQHNLNGGRSTGNLSQHNYQQSNSHSSHGHGVGGYLGQRSSYYAQSEYLETRPDNFSLNITGDGASSINQEQQRETPHKFNNDHSTVSLSAGLLICVKPKYSASGVTNIVKILQLGANDSSRRLFQSFPGPLVRGITHKKTIIEFCEDQIRLGPPSQFMRSRHSSMSSLNSVNQTNRASFVLMWNLLILLLRQNGVVIGTDIAELLIKNKSQFPYEIISTISKASTSFRHNSVDSSKQNSPSNNVENNENDNNTNDNDNDNDIDDTKQIEDSESAVSETKKILTEQEITEKFRNYLLYGNVNEALDWATDNNLWGHALFLASKVDRRSHANVMMKFANKLSLNDPLQTLYQLMSGRTPSSVTSIQDEKWGDWRPHLAMILSNTSQKPDLDRKAITTLGDSLYNRGDLFGAHFCYLMAQVGFGTYCDAVISQNERTTFMANAQNSVRLILLGSSHNKCLKEFATNEAIMMTEIYEYACSLNDDKFSIVEFQPFKYLLATRMLDYGNQLKALMYMEQIALHIKRDPSKYELSFIGKIYDLADRLKYYDPVLEKTIDDIENDPNQQSISGGAAGLPIEDQKWLQDLRKVLGEHNTNVSSMNNIYSNQSEQQQLSENYESVENNRAQIDQQFIAINQQFSELSLQYSNFDPMQMKQQQDQPQSIDLQENQSGQGLYGAGSEQQQFYNPNDMSGGIQIQTSNGDSLTSGYDSMQQQQQLSYLSGQQNSLSSGQGSYEYWDQQQQHQGLSNEVPIPTISLPNSSKKGLYDDDTDNGALKTSGENAMKPKGGQQTADKNNTKTKSSSSSSQNSGWFGGIWNKLSLKPKNQMILPDDKNPAIVWDADKKKWVNTDGETEESESFKPPPKMADIMPMSNNYQNQQPSSNSMEQQAPMYNLPMQSTQEQPQQQIIPMMPSQSPSPNLNQSALNGQIPSGNLSTPGEPNKVPNLQSNMFKMQRNRTLKKSYVDVFNPSGAASKPVEPVLAPAMPTAVPQGGFFIPTPDSGNNSMQQQQPQQQPQQQKQDGVPQFYNPNQFSGYQQ